MSRRTAAWLAWSVCTVCVVLIALALLLDFMTDQSVMRFSPGERYDPGFAVLTGVLSLAYPTVGALIVSRLPANPIGWIFCGLGLLYDAERFTTTYADYALLQNVALPWGEFAAWFSTWIGFAYPTLGVFLLLLFPSGRLPSRRWRIVAWAALLGAALAALGDAFMPGLLLTHYYVDNPFGIVGVIGGKVTTYAFFAASRYLGHALLLTSNFVALFSLIPRFRHASANERQQLKWFMFAAVPLTVFLSVLELMIVPNMIAYPTCSLCLPEPWLWQVFRAIRYMSILALLVVPVFTYIAILKYRLYDIDVVINRTLVYGALSVCVVGIYVLAVVALGYVFQAQGDLAISLTATGLVAVVFQPLRGRLQRGVNRLMYGERDEPYAVISRLGKRVEAAIEPEAVLPTVVETIAQALKLPYAAILLKEDEDFRTAASYGSPKGEPETIPLVYQREEIGRLILSPRAPGEAFSEVDRSLLEDLARQAEVAVHAVRLTADLQRSRGRLVTAREEERRRLRRDLHDGLGPTLGALTLGLDTTRFALIQGDPKAVEALLLELKSQAQEAVSDVRRLVYGLRPPALDDLGLVQAIRQQAANHGLLLADDFPNGTATKRVSSKNGLVFRVKASEVLPSLPAAVEVACYRIAQEAITNTARHSGASSCLVSLCLEEADGTLELEIVDDGTGIPEGRSAGVGMSSMRERAEELGGTVTVGDLPGGGTRVLARLPLPAREEEEQPEDES
jgi:two-component system NarL family sensor kinase